MCMTLQSHKNVLLSMWSQSLGSEVQAEDLAELYLCNSVSLGVTNYFTDCEIIYM